MQLQPDTVKDKLKLFIGSTAFHQAEDYLPTQRGKSIGDMNFELKEHQKLALDSLSEMRKQHQSLYQFVV